MTDPALSRQLANFERVVLHGDADLAQAVLHPDYALVLVNPVPALITRDRWLEVLPDYHVKAYEVQTQHLHVLGSCATLLQSLQMTATVLGEDRSGTFVVSDVWLRGDDGWRIWRRHSTPLAAAQCRVRTEPREHRSCGLEAAPALAETAQLSAVRSSSH